MMVGCNQPAGSQAAKSNGGATSKASTSRHQHTYDETKWEHDDEGHWHPATCEHSDQQGSWAEHEYVKVDAESKEATCGKDGVLVEKCVCGAKRETVLKANPTYHTWGNPSKEGAAVADTSSGWKVVECSTCHAVALVVDAMTYVETGTDTAANAFGLKSAPDASLKMAKNGNWVKYRFAVDQKFENAQVCLFGWVDHYNDSTNHNENRGHIVSNNPTFSITVNDAAVEVTNDDSFKQMGMIETDQDDGSGDHRGSDTICPVGSSITIESGNVEIKYKREASYNLNIKAIYFIVPGAAA